MKPFRRLKMQNKTKNTGKQKWNEMDNLGRGGTARQEGKGGNDRHTWIEWGEKSEPKAELKADSGPQFVHLEGAAPGHPGRRLLLHTEFLCAAAFGYGYKKVVKGNWEADHYQLSCARVVWHV